jgi:hypothetical protein
MEASMMILEWLRLLLRQATYALSVVTGLLLLGEILIPGLVLPFLNLHVLVVATLGLPLFFSPPQDEGETQRGRRWLRLIPVLPVALMLIAYGALLLAGTGPSAMLLLGASIILIASAVIAITYGNDIQ